jgi:hypothetical protein
MKLIGQVLFQLAGSLLTVLVWRRFGLVGVLVAMPITFVIGWYWAKAKHRWWQRW